MNVNKEHLKNLKYSDLRKLAKERGIRGNLKAEKIISAILSQGNVWTNSCLNKDTKNDFTEFQETEVINNNENLEPMQELEIENEQQPEIEAEQQPEIETERRPEIENERRPEIENERRPEIENERRSEIENERQSEIENERQSEIENEGQPEIENEQQPEIENEGQPEIENEQQPEIENDVKDSIKIVSKIPKLSPVTQKKDSHVKKPRTPNFARIHQSAFEKMESIDEYVRKRNKRTEELSAVRGLTTVSKTSDVLKDLNPRKQELLIPKEENSNSSLPTEKKHSRKIRTPRSGTGIWLFPSGLPSKPFTFPTGDRLSNTLRDWSQSNEENVHQVNSHIVSKVSSEGPRPIFRFGKPSQNIPQPLVKPAFDLQASLARKLPYKPHAGPLKPLPKIGLKENYTSGQSVSSQIREKSREVLRGVRQNKRFELQMNYRGSVN